MISIVILNWNSGAYLTEVFESVAAQDDSNWELIVVDNGSGSDSLSVIGDFEARGVITHCIRNSANVGFAEGMNIGIARAAGDVIVALNSDASLARNFVSQVSIASRAAADTKSKVGTFAVTVLDWDFGPSGSKRTDRVQVLGVSVVRRLAVCTWAPTIDDPGTLIGPSGSVVIMTRAAVEAAIAFDGSVYDSRYFAYAEDMDLFLKLYALGFTVQPLRTTHVWHIGSASSNQNVALHRKPMRLQQLAHANKWRTWKKLGGFKTRLETFPWIVLDDLLRLVHGPARIRLMGAYFRNYIELFSWVTRRYPAVRYPFAGTMFSSSTPGPWRR